MRTTNRIRDGMGPRSLRRQRSRQRQRARPPLMQPTSRWQHRRTPTSYQPNARTKRPGRWQFFRWHRTGTPNQSRPRSLRFGRNRPEEGRCPAMTPHGAGRWLADLPRRPRGVHVAEADDGASPVRCGLLRRRGGRVDRRPVAVAARLASAAHPAPRLRARRHRRPVLAGGGDVDRPPVLQVVDRRRCVRLAARAGRPLRRAAVRASRGEGPRHRDGCAAAVARRERRRTRTRTRCSAPPAGWRSTTCPTTRGTCCAPSEGSYGQSADMVFVDEAWG